MTRSIYVELVATGEKNQDVSHRLQPVTETLKTTKNAVEWFCEELRHRILKVSIISEDSPYATKGLWNGKH